LTQIREKVGDYEHDGLSEVSNSWSLDEAGVSILSLVLVENVAKNETMQTTTE